MKKSDLKSGMRVFSKEGKQYLVIKDYETEYYGIGVLCNMNKDSFMPFSDYDDNLECDDDRFTICKVYSPKYDASILSKNMDEFTLLWERRSIKLTQFEYDLLSVCSKDMRLTNHKLLRGMLDKGYFKGVSDTNMRISEILNHCEVE